MSNDPSVLARRRIVRTGCAIALVVLAACTPTARTSGPYAAKARATARAVHSAVASVLLVIDAMNDGHTTAAYVSTATSEAEDQASEATSTFLSIQPPGAEAEVLRAQLSQLLSNVQDVLGDARIAGRRGDDEGLARTGDQLDQVDEQLQHAAQGEPFTDGEASSR